MSHPVVIRPVTHDDNAALREIYDWAVANTTATMDTQPRTKAQQAMWIDAHDGSPYPGLVAEDLTDDDGRVLGYAALSAYNPRPGYRTTAEVSIYVHPQWQGLRVGQQLLEALIRDASRHGFVSLVSLISADNAPSLRLHESHGFEIVGTLHQAGRKFEAWVDVTFMQLLLPDAEVRNAPHT